MRRFFKRFRKPHREFVPSVVPLETRSMMGTFLSGGTAGRDPSRDGFVIDLATQLSAMCAAIDSENASGARSGLETGGSLTQSSLNSYELVWSDEFNGSSIDTGKWNLTGPWGGAPVSSSWSNFSYSSSNVSEADGVAKIEVHKDGSNWTGGIISTSGIQTFQYGILEVRARIPGGQGLWPAIWMYAGSGAQEIDTMEFLGGDLTTLYQTYHFLNDQGQHAQHTASPTSTDWSDSYHVFKVDWQPGQLSFYVDDVQTGSWTDHVPSSPMYLTINLDVGGPNDWGGGVDSSTPTFETMYISYARFYQQI